MKLDVIIPTYNRKKELLETLKAFSNQTYKNFEIIIVDDGSTDGTIDVLKNINFPFKIKCIFQNHGGPAIARNQGIKESSSEIIFFTGDDIIPSENLLEEHINFHQKRKKKNLVVLGYTKWDNRIKRTPFIKYVGNYHFAYSTIFDKENVDWGCFYTSNISINREFLIKNGIFDESFLFAAYEDTELSYRLHKKGMQIIFNKDAIAYHNHFINFKDYQKVMFNKGKSAINLVNKVPILKRKANYKETKNPIKLFFKKLILNIFIVSILIEIICFLDKLFIPFPKICYIKIMDFFRIKGIKESL